MAVKTAVPSDVSPGDAEQPVAGGANKSTRRAEAENVVKNYMLAALGMGLIPIPVLDLALFIGTDLLMVRRICAFYDVPFKGNRARSAVAALASTMGAAGTAGWLSFSMSKLIPGMGTAVGLMALPVANSAFTFVVGKVFIAHFEAGGTLLDFNAASHVDHVKDLYAEGKAKASSILKKKDGSADAAAAA